MSGFYDQFIQYASTINMSEQAQGNNDKKIQKKYFKVNKDLWRMIYEFSLRVKDISQIK